MKQSATSIPESEHSKVFIVDEPNGSTRLVMEGDRCYECYNAQVGGTGCLFCPSAWMKVVGVIGLLALVVMLVAQLAKAFLGVEL